MHSTELAVFLKTALEQHSRRCAVTKSAISAGCWPAASNSLRQATAEAQDWARQVNQLADWCDAQAAHGQGTAAASAAITAPVTLEALEAGLMALASGLGHDHSARVLDAISSTFSATHACRRLPTEAVVIGQALDHDSLEQGEPA